MPGIAPLTVSRLPKFSRSQVDAGSFGSSTRTPGLGWQELVFEQPTFRRGSRFSFQTFI